MMINSSNNDALITALNVSDDERVKQKSWYINILCDI